MSWSFICKWSCCKIREVFLFILVIFGSEPQWTWEGRLTFECGVTMPHFSWPATPEGECTDLLLAKMCILDPLVQEKLNGWMTLIESVTESLPETVMDTGSTVVTTIEVL